MTSGSVCIVGCKILPRDRAPKHSFAAHAGFEVLTNARTPQSLPDFGRRRRDILDDGEKKEISLLTNLQRKRKNITCRRQLKAKPD